MPSPNYDRSQTNNNGNPTHNKRSIEGYEEKFCIQLAGQYIILAENLSAAKPYLVCNAKSDNTLGLEEYSDGVVTGSYIEAVRIFLRRADGLAEALENERRASSLPFHTLTAADCIPVEPDVGWKGKVVIVKPEILSPDTDALNTSSPYAQAVSALTSTPEGGLYT
jgi:hypothetical protein